MLIEFDVAEKLHRNLILNSEVIKYDFHPY